MSSTMPILREITEIVKSTLLALVKLWNRRVVKKIADEAQKAQ